MLPRFAREGAHPPRVALRHALFRFFHHGAPPLSFSGSAPAQAIESLGIDEACQVSTKPSPTFVCSLH